VRAAAAVAAMLRRSCAVADRPAAGAVAPPQTPPMYRHTQFGKVVAAGTAVGLVAAVLMTLSLSPATLAAAKWSVVALYAIIAAAFALFSTLTVEVDAREIRVRFGIGLFRKTVALADIRRCEVLRTKIWWGWGLHWTPSGWLYNVSGREAVRLEFASERPLMIGSDEAQALKAAIDARRPAARGPGAADG
jgi:hypothetical protein